MRRRRCISTDLRSDLEAGTARPMDLDTLLLHYFGTSDPTALDDAPLVSGMERLGTTFGTETQPGRRFALWSLLHALGEAPDPVLAFEDPQERRAAQAYAGIAGRVSED